MGIKDKATYGEYYWAMQVEATSAFDEAIEDALSPYFSGLFADMPEISELPAGTQNFMRALAEPRTRGLGSYLTSAAGEFSAEIIKEAIAPAMTMLKRLSNRRSRETWLTAQ
ncbi:unnamed protein product, partial [marine sediment metagenome]